MKLLLCALLLCSCQRFRPFVGAEHLRSHEVQVRTGGSVKLGDGRLKGYWAPRIEVRDHPDLDVGFAYPLGVGVMWEYGGE